ncbi:MULTISPECIES: TPM domain-containing protein [unclassified Modestobacter]
MRRLAIVLGVLAVLLGPGSLARAEEPMELDGQLTDRADALSGEEEGQVADALAELEAEHGLTLFVTFVSGFDEATGADVDWAGQTAELSELGESSLLLAVDHDVDAYEWWIAEDSWLGQANVEELMTTEVEPLLTDEDYVGAVTALVEGLGADPDLLSADDTSSPETIVGIAASLLVVLAGGNLYLRRRAAAGSAH